MAGERERISGDQSSVPRASHFGGDRVMVYRRKEGARNWIFGELCLDLDIPF